VAISGFEDHSVSVIGNDQVVTYDDSNVFIERNGPVNANTGDTDSSGLNVVDVTGSRIRSGNSGDAEEDGYALSGGDEDGQQPAPQENPPAGQAQPPAGQPSGRQGGSEGGSQPVVTRVSSAHSNLSAEAPAGQTPSPSGRPRPGRSQGGPNGGPKGGSKGGSQDLRTRVAATGPNQPTAPPDDASSADGAVAAPNAAPSYPPLQGGQSFGTVTDEGSSAEIGDNNYVVGADGFDDVSIRSSGNRNIVTYDDSNLVIGGSGPVNAQIGDSDTGGTVVMGVHASDVEGGCEGDLCYPDVKGRQGKAAPDVSATPEVPASYAKWRRK
jgi:hypothetical protein